MSSLLDIGSQCSEAACNELDFLPITCQCGKTFCRHHISPESHQCAAVVDAPADHRPFDKLHGCDVLDCSQPSLNAFVSGQDMIPTCLACKYSFCAVHRHPSSHSCEPAQLPEKKEMHSAARALLAKNFPASTKKAPSRRVARPPTDPIKLAQFRKVELMKMRHNAMPGDPKDGSRSASLEERLHVRLAGDGSIFWFRKTLVAGKVLDFLTPHAKIKFSDEFLLHLNKILTNGDNEVLLNDRPIGDQVEDGETLSVTCTHR